MRYANSHLNRGFWEKNTQQSKRKNTTIDVIAFTKVVYSQWRGAAMKTTFHFDSFVIMCDYDPMFSVVGFNFFSTSYWRRLFRAERESFRCIYMDTCMDFMLSFFLHFDFHCYLLGFPFFDLFLEWSLICKINNGWEKKMKQTKDSFFSLQTLIININPIQTVRRFLHYVLKKIKEKTV